MSATIENKIKEENRIRQSLRSILDPDDILDELSQPYYVPKSSSLGICKLDVTITLETINIHVHLNRPGLLIGKEGRTIDYIKERLTKWHGVPVTISITEVDPFHVRP